MAAQYVQVRTGFKRMYFDRDRWTDYWRMSVNSSNFVCTSSARTQLPSEAWRADLDRYPVSKTSIVYTFVVQSRISNLVGKLRQAKLHQYWKPNSQMLDVTPALPLFSSIKTCHAVCILNTGLSFSTGGE